jgi:hypothetical protein
MQRICTAATKEDVFMVWGFGLKQWAIETNLL